MQTQGQLQEHSPGERWAGCAATRGRHSRRTQTHAAHHAAQVCATAQWPPVQPLRRSGIRVVWPQAWLPSPRPPPSPDSLAFCAHTQRAPLTARRCGLGSAPVLLRAPPGLLGWHDQPNVKQPRRPLGCCGACPCWLGQECGDSPSGHCREKISSVLSPPGPPPRDGLSPGDSLVTRNSQVLPRDAAPEG